MVSSLEFFPLYLLLSFVLFPWPGEGLCLLKFCLHFIFPFSQIKKVLAYNLIDLSFSLQAEREKTGPEVDFFLCMYICILKLAIRIVFHVARHQKKCEENHKTSKN